MKESIFSRKSMRALRTCAFVAYDRHGYRLERELEGVGISRQWLSDPALVRIAFDGILRSINWTKISSIANIAPIFSDDYAERAQEANGVFTTESIVVYIQTASRLSMVNSPSFKIASISHD
jgi:hypothetical protein